MEKLGGLLERASRTLDIPGDIVAGVPKIQLLGDGEVRISPHRGILSYGSQEIHIAGGSLLLVVRGQGLELRGMNPLELFITGRISQIELVR